MQKIGSDKMIKKIFYIISIFISVLVITSCNDKTETLPDLGTPEKTPTPFDIEYTITFDSNGGSAVSDTKVELNQYITKPADPTKEGFKFVGWYSDKE